MKRAAAIGLVYAGACILLFYPLLPGSYDPAGQALSLMLQLYSILGLIPCIPAGLWLYQTLRLRAAPSAAPEALRRYRRTLRVCLWGTAAIFLPILLVLAFGLSRLLGALLFLALALAVWHLLGRIAQISTATGTPWPAALALLPLTLLLCHLSLSAPLTAWSRAQAIRNSQELIGEIERFHSRYGHYPATLNAIYKDYQTGVCGIEAFRYTYGGSTYHLYFEQPKLFLDQPGTRELVVYSPDGQPFMMSHVSWHMLIPPEQIRSSQGWYAAHEAGAPGWKYLWFD
jgi:hypothetical protein